MGVQSGITMKCVMLMMLVMCGECVRVANDITIHQEVTNKLNRVTSNIVDVIESQDVTALEIDSRTNPINTTETCFEDSIIGDSGFEWISVSQKLTVSFVVVAALLFIGIIATGLHLLFSKSLPFETPRRVKGMFWFSFSCIAFFVLVACAEMVLVNLGLSTAGVTIREFFNMLSSNGFDEFVNDVNVVILFRKQMTYLLQTKLTNMEYINSEEPPVCAYTYRDLDDSFNRYTSGSVVHTFNLRRMFAYDAPNVPDIDEIRAQLTQIPFQGGISTQTATAVGIISNECEQFSGNITMCCDDTLADSSQMISRCPGKVLSQFSNDHCACLDGLSRYGYGFDLNQLVMCVVHLRTKVERWILKLRDRGIVLPWIKIPL